MKNNFRNNLPIINLYKKKDLKSKIDTQLLYGDNFKVKKKLKSFSKPGLSTGFLIREAMRDFLLKNSRK